MADSLLLNRALSAVQQGDLSGARRMLDAVHDSAIDLDEVFHLYQLEIETQAEQLQDSQRRAEQALAWFSNLFRTLPVAALLVDRQGLIVDANAHALDELGLRQAGRSTPPLRRLVADPGDDSRLATLLAQSSIGTTASLDDLRLTTLDGRTRWADLRLTQVPARVGEGDSPLCLCVFNDRTARVEAQQAREAADHAEFERDLAQAASRSKSQLLSRVSHELRTPLNAVIGFSQLLLSAPQQHLSADEARRIGHIHSAGQRLLALVDDILMINQADTGRMALTLQAVRLGPLVQDVMEAQEPSFAPLNLTVSMSVEDGLDDTAWADPKRAREVLDNLLSNAVKYNRPGGWVTVRVQGLDGQLCVEVRDSGIGLTAEQLNHLFEPFNRLGAERTKVQGYGLGMSIARMLAQAMGGDLTAHSQAGLGSSFELRLPPARGAAPPA